MPFRSFRALAVLLILAASFVPAARARHVEVNDGPLEGVLPEEVIALLPGGEVVERVLHGPPPVAPVHPPGCPSAGAAPWRNGVVVWVRIEECFPYVPLEPGPDDLCRHLDRECCKGVSSSCLKIITQLIMDLTGGQVSSEEPVAFCLGVRFDGSDPTGWNDVGSACGSEQPPGGT